MICTAVNAWISNGLSERSEQTLANKIKCSLNGKNNKNTLTTMAHNFENNEPEQSVKNIFYIVKIHQLLKII